jgi:hypothetical protein
MRWVDPSAGIAQVRAQSPYYTLILGLNNQMLGFPATHRGDLQNVDRAWREVHEQSCQRAQGYLFHTDSRNCWAVLTWPGESNDVSLVD